MIAMIDEHDPEDHGGDDELSVLGHGVSNQVTAKPIASAAPTTVQ